MTAQYLTCKCQIHESVLGLVNGTCGTEEGNSAALFVEQGRFSDVVLLTVERHDVARCRHPQGQS